jgi:very-short-patch-repair endonuclease
LVIEIDGDQHGQQDHRKRDRERDEWLYGQGLQVLRVTNREVLQEMDGVLETILKIIEERAR